MGTESFRKAASGSADTITFYDEHGGIFFFPNHRIKNAEYNPQEGTIRIIYGPEVVTISGTRLEESFQALIVKQMIDEVRVAQDPMSDSDPIVDSLEFGLVE